MTFKNLEAVFAHKFAGNFRDDAEAFDAITEFGNEHPEHYIEVERFAAINGMGIDPAECANWGQ